MPPVPVRCMNCGASFSMNVPAGANWLFQGNTTSCPRCGGEARIADFQTDAHGRMHFLSSAYRILRDPNVTIRDLERAADIAERARRSRTEPERVAADIAAVNPKLAPLQQLLRPTNAAEFYACLTLLLYLLQWLTGHFANAPHTINQTIVNHIEQTIVYESRERSGGAGEAVKPDSQPGSGHQIDSTKLRRRTTHAESEESIPRRRATTRKPTKAWRNSRCRCGSGKKYRACCGAP